MFHSTHFGDENFQAITLTEGQVNSTHYTNC